MIRLLCTILFSALTSLSANAQEEYTFKTERMKQAAKALGILNVPDSVNKHGSWQLLGRDGQMISVRTDSTGMVEHIGVPLFMNNIRVLEPSPVYDFLEYAALNWKYKFTPNTLYLSKVLFRHGNWQVLLNGHLDKADCAISNQDDRLYIVKWTQNEEVLAELGIPIEYELLNNDTRRNIEKLFINQLSEHQSQRLSDRPQKTITEDDLKIYGTEGLFVLQGDSYMIEELNQNVYYELTTLYEEADTIIHGNTVTMKIETVAPTITLSDEHPAETFANLMLADDATLPDVMMHLDFHLSDYHRLELQLPLSSLKDFLLQEGCRLFFAYSGTIKEQARGILFVHNAAEGYNHLLSLSLPAASLTEKSPEVKAAVYLYIPNVDTSHLFGKMPTKKSGAKIYN